MSRDYVSHDNAKQGQWLITDKGYVYRVEKVSPKTIVVSELRNKLENPQVYTFEKSTRMNVNNFNNTYRPITQQEHDRARQLEKRNKFIREFERKS